MLIYHNFRRLSKIGEVKIVNRILAKAPEKPEEEIDRRMEEPTKKVKELRKAAKEGEEGRVA